MKREFLTSDKVFIHPTKFAYILLNSLGYSDLHDKLTKSDLEYSDAKVHEVAPSGFVDFNQHLYSDINHMNSISCGIYIESSLVTFRIFIWGSKGEGFEMIKHVLQEVDWILIMSVNPGFGGQTFIPDSLNKIATLNQWRQEQNLSYVIEVDGGVNEETARLCEEAGADVVVAGSAVFNAVDRQLAIQKIKG